MLNLNILLSCLCFGPFGAIGIRKLHKHGGNSSKVYQTACMRKECTKALTNRKQLLRNGDTINWHGTPRHDAHPHGSKHAQEGLLGSISKTLHNSLRGVNPDVVVVVGVFWVGPS